MECLSSRRVRVPPGGGGRAKIENSSRRHPRKSGQKRFLAVRRSWRGNGVACFCATSLEEIIGGVIAIISFRPGGWMQQSAVPRCAILSDRSTGRHRAVKRRDFITLVGGAAVAWPLAVRAQQGDRLPTIGFLGQSTRSAASEWVAAFVQRLRELGWTEGRTIAIEYRWSEGRAERAAQSAAEFVRLKVNVIVTSGTPQTLATKQATSIIPIVFATAGDPVANGLVANLARPGGNITGLSAQGPRGGTLCLYGRARERQSDSNQHLGAERATSDHARLSRLRRSGRSDVLWSKPPGPVPAFRRLCRQNSARGKARRYPGRAADQV